MRKSEWKFYEESWNYEEDYKDFAVSKRNRKNSKKLKKVRRQKENEYDKSNSQKRKA